jgi:hypothetical protein
MRLPALARPKQHKVRHGVHAGTRHVRIAVEIELLIEQLIQIYPPGTL